MKKRTLFLVFVFGIVGNLLAFHNYANSISFEEESKTVAYSSPTNVFHPSVMFFNDCVEDINFTAADSPIGAGTYSAANSITTEANDIIIVNPSDEVIFQAGTVIILRPGFSVAPDATGMFTAKIEACTVENDAPTVSFVTPTDGQVLFEGDDLTVQVNANDSDGSVVGVELFYDNVSQGTETITYEWMINNLVVGQHTLRAVATDDDGATGEATITITVDPVNNEGDPVVTISNPQDGQQFVEGVDLTVTASATDPDGIKNIRLLLNGATIRVIQSDQGTWDASTDPALAALDTGSYEIKVVAVDNLNNIGEEVINITVIAAGSPMVSFITPTDGQVYPEGSDVVVEVDATDADGSISSVDLFLNDSFVRTESIAPYQWGLSTQNDVVFANMSPGTYVLEAIATDNEGKMNSATITFFVEANNVAPTVSFVMPTDGQMFQEGATLNVEATASDTDGTVAGVEFFYDGVSQGTDNAAPYQWTVNNLAIGTYSLQVVATDDDGATAQETITITVTAAPENPVVTISTPADGANFPVGTDLTVMASATDPDGIKNIRLLLNGATIRVIESDQGTWDASTDPMLANLQAGSYEIKVAAVDDSGNNNIGEAVHNITVGGNQVDDSIENRSLQHSSSSLKEWSVYPNPSREVVHLDLSNFMDKAITILLKDHTGRILIKRNLAASHAALESIDLRASAIGTGFYLLTIQTSDSILSKKIVVKK